MSDSWTTLRARVASLSRSRRANDPELLEARAALKALKLEEAVERALREAPPLTTEQRARISALLRPSVGAAR